MSLSLIICFYLFIAVYMLISYIYLHSAIISMVGFTLSQPLALIIMCLASQLNIEIRIGTILVLHMDHMLLMHSSINVRWVKQ